jgi:hypothetical protein
MDQSSCGKPDFIGGTFNYRIYPVAVNFFKFVFEMDCMESVIRKIIVTQSSVSGTPDPSAPVYSQVIDDIVGYRKRITWDVPVSGKSCAIKTV